MAGVEIKGVFAGIAGDHIRCNISGHPWRYVNNAGGVDIIQGSEVIEMQDMGHKEISAENQVSHDSAVVGRCNAEGRFKI